MFRDTTPTLIFELPFSTSLVDEAAVTLAQNGEIVGEYELDSTLSDENQVGVTLSRRLTSSLTAGVALEIQLWLKVGYESLYSEIFRVPVERILREWEASSDEI